MFLHFSGNLNPEELINWINELEEYFEYEEIEDLDRVRFAKAKLKGHAKIWWHKDAAFSKMFNSEEIDQITLNIG